LKSTRSDKERRHLIAETTIQGTVPFLHASNTITKKSLFFQTLPDEFIYDKEYKKSDGKITLGDLNVAMNPDLDCAGGKPVMKLRVR